MVGTVDWSGTIASVLREEDLDESAAEAIMDEVMGGEVDPVLTSALLVALQAKGASGGEIAGFVRSMLSHVAPIEVDTEVVDTCGTGGDGVGTFNVSTTVALVVAAAGVPVAKHGNRAASGTCGSADLLEGWGVAIELPGPAVATCIAELGIGFMFARTFHPAMRHVAPIRAALGIPTVFNLLGPLSNPAGAARQVVGVANEAMAPVIADALNRLGKEHALVFRGEDGLDELTTTGPSRMWEIRSGTITESMFDPQDLGIERARIEDLLGGDLEVNMTIADAVLGGTPGPAADLVAINAAAALYAADRVDSIAAGLELAREVLASGRALELRDRWVQRSQELAAAAG